MSRSILVTEIFLRTTQARLGSSDENAAVTLMSTDMERIDIGFRSLHEIWASIVQAALASWLLYNQLGILFVAPIGVVLVSFTLLVIFMKFAGDSQRAWMVGVQTLRNRRRLHSKAPRRRTCSGRPISQNFHHCRVSWLCAVSAGAALDFRLHAEDPERVENIHQSLILDASDKSTHTDFPSRSSGLVWFSLLGPNPVLLGMQDSRGLPQDERPSPLEPDEDHE
jgi:hypothetical protein